MFSFKAFKLLFFHVSVLGYDMSCKKSKLVDSSEIWDLIPVLLFNGFLQLLAALIVLIDIAGCETVSGSGTQNQA